MKCSLGWLWIALIVTTCGALRTDAAIDFTPTTGERELEGITFRQLIFHENGRAITYEQPLGWTYSGSASRIRFIPPDFRQAQAEMVQAELTEAQTFDGATTKSLQAQVLTSVPQGSQNTVVVSEEQNPMKLNGRPTYAVTVSYNLFGQDYQLGVIFLNLEKTQIQFRLIARKQDFSKVQRLFRGSLFSLQWH